MGTTVREEFDRKPIPAGVHRATCCWVIDLGTQITNYQGHSKEQSKVLLAWELADVRVTIPASEKGPERSYLQKISQTYTASLSPKALLRSHLEAWRGRQFSETELIGYDLRAELGKTCLLQVIHNTSGGKVYANIAAIMALPSGTPPPQRESPILWFDMDKRTPLPEGMPPWLVDRICQSPEWKERYETDEPPAQDPEQAAADVPPLTGKSDAEMEAEIRSIAGALRMAGPSLDAKIIKARSGGTLFDLLTFFKDFQS